MSIALQALRLEPSQVRASQSLDNGPVWLGLLLDDVDTVLALKPDHGLHKMHRLSVGVAAVRNSLTRAKRTPDGGHGNPVAHEAELEVRAFAASIGVEEDPVTGSFNASAAQWLIGDGLMPERYVVHQGRCLGRDGRVYVERDKRGEVWVGGNSVTCIDGTVIV